MTRNGNDATILKKKGKIMSRRDIVIRARTSRHRRINRKERIVYLSLPVIFIHLPIAPDKHIVLSFIPMSAETCNQLGKCTKRQTFRSSRSYILRRQPRPVMYALVGRKRRCGLGAGKRNIPGSVNYIFLQTDRSIQFQRTKKSSRFTQPCQVIGPCITVIGRFVAVLFMVVDLRVDLHVIERPTVIQI